MTKKTGKYFLAFAATTALALYSLLQNGCVIAEGVNALVNTGSGTFERANRQRAIERVARDWCLMLRAQQIIPVYPLREDIEPGRMFVVQSSTADLKHYWNNKGYLPMEAEMGQLQNLPYSDFYHGSFSLNHQANTPDEFRFPEGSADYSNGIISDWDHAPIAAFATYSFQIRRGEGFNGAIPVEGVPVMMSALGARSANVTVTLKQGYTIGIDVATLHKAVRKWEYDSDHHDQLAQYKPVGDQIKNYNWLRVVTRIYLVKVVNVSVTNDSASSAQLSAGQPKPVNNLFIGQGDAAGNFQKAAEALPTHSLVDAQPATAPSALPESDAATAGTNGGQVTQPAATPSPNDPLAAERMDLEMQKQRMDLATKEVNLSLKQAELGKQQADVAEFERRTKVAAVAAQFGGQTVIPGVTARIASASSTAISMDETFPRPIVIGYDAIEFLIGENGELYSLPCSTLARLRDDNWVPKILHTRLLVNTASDFTRILEWRKTDTVNRDQRISKYLHQKGWPSLDQIGDLPEHASKRQAIIRDVIESQ